MCWPQLQVIYKCGGVRSRGFCHAGDSACSIPPQTIPEECLDTIRDWTTKLAKALKVVGLINIQYCIQDNEVLPFSCRNEQTR